jgi:hypothetical protein
MRLKHPQQLINSARDFGGQVRGVGITNLARNINRRPRGDRKRR